MVHGKRDSLEDALKYQQQYEQIVKVAADSVRMYLRKTPEFGITLGSGLGDLADTITNPRRISYTDIPSFPLTTVPGHEGTMIIGELQDVPVIGLKGRKHFYEVADAPFNTGILQTVFPVHVLAELGVRNYFSTNAVGGLRIDASGKPAFKVGDMMAIKTHINMLPNPLVGRQMEFTRVDNKEKIYFFEPMARAYSSEFRKLLLKAGEAYPGHMHEGTYLALSGKSFETEGECVAFRDGWKADTVGMSTAPEVIVARNRGMGVVGMNCITNVVTADGTNATNHEEVLNVLNSLEVRQRLSGTVRGFFDLYRQSLL
jgi:purine-nucleoside phosphorylase